MTRRARLRLAAGVAMAAGLVLMPAAAASAHPLGNFTRNVYAGITVSPDRVRIDQVVDLAEIPAFQERQQMDADGDGDVSAVEQAGYRQAQCRAISGQVRITAGGAAVPLEVDAATLSFPPGAGGLATLRLECALSGALPSGATALDLDDAVEAGRLGWHEITLAGDGVTLVRPQLPAASPSLRLTRYPSDLLSSPLQQHQASVTWTTGGLAMAGELARPPVADTLPIDGKLPVTGRLPVAVPTGVDAATRAFTGLIGGHELTLAFTVAALALSVLLGAMHAFAPGHGKTLMAGYLVGVGGRWREAVTIGIAVTVTHTAGVLALGLLLVASSTLAPEQVYPWMGLASGVLAVGIGGSLLRAALRRQAQARRADAVRVPALVPALVGAGHPDHDHYHEHEHDQGHEHDHGHHDEHDHDHQPDPVPHRHSRFGRTHTHAPAPGLGDQRVGLAGLISLGLAGGLVPSPSALVVLLAGMAQHRAWFGLALVVGYGIGMALALTTIGLLLVRARGLLERFAGRAGAGRPWITVTRMLPIAAGGVVLLAGGYLVTTALAGL